MRLAFYDLLVLLSRGIRMIGLWTPVGGGQLQEGRRGSVEMRLLSIEYW